MRLIKKKTPPSDFQKYIKQKASSYADMDKCVKKNLRKSLVDEQFGICAYCQQKLKEDRIKIEHHCEQSICNGENGPTDRRLDYTNLFAVCLGKGGQPESLHCDTLKAKKAINPSQHHLPIKILPTNIAHITTFEYSSTGLLKSSNDTFKREINDILNLNATYLKKMRKDKWLSIYRNSCNKKGGVNKLKMKRLIEKTLSLKNDHFTHSFPALAEYMRDKFC
ncbi:MAG: retron system putative HNH endonuclease [Bacteroidota bacterium]